MHSRRIGFTLIELLVVIAIIAILAAIIFPLFLGAKRRALTNQCLSNLKQLADAMRCYADDNYGIMPYDWPGSANWCSAMMRKIASALARPISANRRRTTS